MKNLLISIILLFTFGFCQMVYAHSIPDTVDVKSDQHMKILSEQRITDAIDLRTLRVNKVNTPLIVKGGNSDLLSVKLFAEPGELGQLEVSYEIVGEEIWLSLENITIKSSKNDSSRPDLDLVNTGGSACFLMEITVPEHMNLVLGEKTVKANIADVAGVDINAGDGDFLLEDIVGFVRVRNIAGNLILKNVTGDVWISDKGGCIYVEDVIGIVTVDSDVDLALKVQDIIGDVTISSKHGGTAQVSNVKGNVSVFSRAPIETACIGITGNVIIPDD